MKNNTQNQNFFKGKGNQDANGTCDNMNSLDLTIDLSDEQINDLIFMYQEEKLAMDVYDYFYDTYDLKVFDKISDSEFKHLSAVETLLNAADVDMSMYQDLDAGEFIDEELQALFDSLIEKGNLSLNDALEVGVTIEQVDIEDLTMLLGDTELNENITTVYENLVDGSENHLEAFNNVLDMVDMFIA